MNARLFRTPTRARAAVPAAALTAALLLAGCGGQGQAGSPGHSGHGAATSPSASASPAPAKGAHNAADTAFAQGMIPHHRQAVEMAGLAADRAASPEVGQLAAAVRKEQGPEIETLSGWLAAWGERVPADGDSGHGGHGGAMSGMMTGEDMARLEKATGPAFDRAFLELMTRHHEGAVAMARTEKSEGAYPPAKDLADAVIASQSAEITRMKALLDRG
ncbi:DUF305 domain-containing protein [Streptomyces sp. ODS05-4]|uniref:DUF305 domain-containing protein n=1 Tax=Streptomyces sp. ODS05-4 TaxID=2944939 RepID=UPI00210ED5CA|nr:DUF305 domain-containing protein [Streptomyces sp. ODS05-4]